MNLSPVNKLENRDGISVIVPSFGTQTNLERCLESVSAQTLDLSYIQVIVVLNGELGDKGLAVQKWSLAHPELDCVVAVSNPPGAGRARNVGLSMVDREFTTFLDDDDWIQPRFLEHGLRLASRNCLAVLPNLEEERNGIVHRNSLNLRISMLAGRELALRRVPWVLGYNAGKIAPSTSLTGFRYPEELNSGEDVVYFANLLTTSLSARFAESDSNGYVRTKGKLSVSRQPDSFDFCVRQRFEVIAALRKIDPFMTKDLQRSQLGFTERYHSKHRDETFKIRLEAARFDLPKLGFLRNRSERVVFTSAFPPTSDPSGNVVLKRILTGSQSVDVVDWDMSSIRRLDVSLGNLAKAVVGRRFTVPGPPSFGNWGGISTSAIAGALMASYWNFRHGRYREVYSRALWSWGHVAAFLFRLIHPNCFWIAEFSDPMKVDSQGEKRSGEVGWSLVALLMRLRLRRHGLISRNDWSHFALVEAVTLAEADEILFTNRAQLELILEDYPKEFKDMVLGKASIAPQPIPPSWVYYQSDFVPDLEKDAINIGYFGSFYANRDLRAVSHSLDLEGDSFRLYAYCPEARSSDSGGAKVVQREPLDYLDFLAALRTFDVLLVVDTASGEIFSRNPYLPSKLADYLGSEVPIWGVVEEGSPLDTGGHLAYKSILGDINSLTSVLTDIKRDVGARRK